MSSMYNVTAQARTDTYVDLAVTVVHPDAGPVSDDLGFAFTLLCDPIVDYRGRTDGGPLAREVDLQDYLDKGFVRENACGFVASSRIIDEDNHPPPGWNDPGYQEFWESGPASVAVLRIEPTHRGWISHITPGDHWDTATYARHNIVRWKEGFRWPGDRISEVSDDPLEGMTRRGRDERLERYAAALERDLYVIPRFGTLHYAAPAALSGAELTVEAVRPWLGWPVLAERDGERNVGMLVEVRDDGACTLYFESGGSYGTRGTSLSRGGSMGRAFYVRRHDVTKDMPAAIRQLLIDNPDDFETWSVYADLLTDKGNPLGPLIRATRKSRLRV
jgi:uncharacterized protein (TIGR02996 family)